MGPLTALLGDWGKGDEQARELLLERVYTELRRIAGAQMRREPKEHTLTPTALVHEVYLKLAGEERLVAKDRGHFYAIVTGLMRRVLVDYARRRLAAKRGGGARPADWADAIVSNEADATEALDVHLALEELATLDPSQARIVEMRYFGGLTSSETAEALQVDEPEVEKEWRLGKAWLRKKLG